MWRLLCVCVTQWKLPPDLRVRLQCINVSVTISLRHKISLVKLMERHPHDPETWIHSLCFRRLPSWYDQRTDKLPNDNAIARLHICANATSELERGIRECLIRPREWKLVSFWWASKVNLSEFRKNSGREPVSQVSLKRAIRSEGIHLKGWPN